MSALSGSVPKIADVCGTRLLAAVSAENEQEWFCLEHRKTKAAGSRALQ
jgi:hypothetical protein